MLIADGDAYPAGDAGDLAVYFFRPSGGAWRRILVGDRSEADEQIRKTVNSDDVRWDMVLSTGRKSPLVWIARCKGGQEWEVIWATKGYRERLTEWGDQMAADCEIADY